MNDVSSFFILLFGVIFGYIFPSLLEELGVPKKISRSWIAIFSLALLSFLGFILYPIILFQQFTLNGVENFYDPNNSYGKIFLWLAIAFLIGGALHLAYQMFRDKN